MRLRGVFHKTTGYKDMITNISAWSIATKIMTKVMETKKESDFWLKIYHNMRDNYLLEEDTALLASLAMWDIMKKAGANDEESKTN